MARSSILIAIVKRKVKRRTPIARCTPCTWRVHLPHGHEAEAEAATCRPRRQKRVRQRARGLLLSRQNLSLSRGEKGGARLALLTRTGDGRCDSEEGCTLSGAVAVGVWVYVDVSVDLLSRKCKYWNVFVPPSLSLRERDAVGWPFVEGA